MGEVVLGLAMLATASAAPVPDAEEPPLAIPAGSPPPPRLPSAGRPPGRRLQGGSPADVSPELARAFRHYRLEHLTVRRTLGYSVTAVSPYVGWAVFSGVERLDVPTYLATIGRHDERLALERRIRSARTAGTSLCVLGGAGAVATVAGLIGMDHARTEGFRTTHASHSELVTWGTVSAVGFVGMVGGFVAGSFPSARARTLFAVPAASRSLDDMEQEILDYNEELAARLGLTPGQALQLEAEAERP